MKKNKFEVKIYYSGFCTYEVNATDEADAIIKARNLPINRNEIINTIEKWEEADIAEVIKDK